MDMEIQALNYINPIQSNYNREKYIDSLICLKGQQTYYESGKFLMEMGSYNSLKSSNVLKLNISLRFIANTQVDLKNS